MRWFHRRGSDHCHKCDRALQVVTYPALTGTAGAPETSPGTRLTIRGLTMLGCPDTSHTRLAVRLEPIIRELLIALSLPSSDGKYCFQCTLPLFDAKPLEQREHASVKSSDVGSFDVEIAYQATSCGYCGAVQIGAAGAGGIAKALARALTQGGARVVSSNLRTLRTGAGDTDGTLLSCAICNARIGVLTAQCSACRTRFTWRERFDRVGHFVVLWIIACMGWGMIGYVPAVVIVDPRLSIETQAALFIGALVLGFLTAFVLARWLSREAGGKFDDAIE